MVRIRRFHRKWMDINLPAVDGNRARIVERPGLWMSRADLAGLLRDLWTVADACVSHPPIRYGVLSGIKERLDSALVTILNDGVSGRPVAFSAATLVEMDVHGRRQDILHLGLTMVVPGSRKRGLCRALSAPASLLLLLRNWLRPIWITNVTQVPAAFGTVAELFDDVFPTADPGCRPTESHLAIARQLMRHHRTMFGVAAEAGFDDERFVITNAYTGGSAPLKKTIAEASPHRSRAVNELCGTSLDYDRGDDFLQVGQLTVRAVIRQLLSDPRAYRVSRPLLEETTLRARSEGGAS